MNEQTPVASEGLTRLQLAGWLMLALPILMFGSEMLNAAFHFAPSLPGHPGGGDIGLIFIIWFGIGLVCNKDGYREVAVIICIMYVLVGVAAAVVPMVWHNGGGEFTLLVVHVNDPAEWQWLIFGGAFVFPFGTALYFLLCHPERAMRSKSVA